jgi:homeobox protein cut-like
MKQIEFGQEDEGEDESSNGIDSQLLNRNKLLTQEVAEYRSQHDDLNNKIRELTDQFTEVSEQYTKAQALNEKLERDLTNFQDSNKFNDTASIISTMTRGTTASRAFGRNGSISEEPNNSSSILPIITKQRDRFRERNAELEEDHKKSNAIINELKRQVNNLKNDNEELYERTRYVASFNEGNRVNNKKLLRPKPNIDYENNPYQRSYETKIHPLEQFRMREQERIHAKLSPIERLFISFTRAILATRTTRMLFLLYCVALHCIVMLVTVYASSLHTAFVPEVGLNVSTGGVASGQVGTPDALNNVFHAD